MSLRAKLTWAFLVVTAVALLLAFAGLNAGMHRHMRGMPLGGLGMRHEMMMGSREWATETLRWSLISGVAAFAVAGAAGVFTAERISRSLRRLRDAAQTLDLRDLSHRVPVEGTDEIADLARTFNHMGERMESAERSRRQLLADVAHELRHPLAVMQGRLDLLQDGKVELEPSALLPLQDEVIRLTRLVGDLRDLSLAEVGALSLDRVTVAIDGLVCGLAEHFEPIASARGIALVCDVPDGSLQVKADPDRLRQVLANLLSNALQYTPAGGRAGVRVAPGGGAGAGAGAGWIRIEVWDTGVGIAPEDLPHVFDRFYRTDRSRTRNTGGSGLGLAIVRGLVEAHGGRVEVRSAPGEGSTFTLLLPV